MCDSLSLVQFEHQLSKSEQDRCLVLQGKGHTPGEIHVKLGVTMSSGCRRLLHLM